MMFMIWPRMSAPSSVTRHSSQEQATQLDIQLGRTKLHQKWKVKYRPTEWHDWGFVLDSTGVLGQEKSDFNYGLRTYAFVRFFVCSRIPVESNTQRQECHFVFIFLYSFIMYRQLHITNLNSWSSTITYLSMIFFSF